jgi:hypothetical protein
MPPFAFRIFANSAPPPFGSCFTRSPLCPILAPFAARALLPVRLPEEDPFGSLTGGVAYRCGAVDSPPRGHGLGRP